MSSDIRSGLVYDFFKYIYCSESSEEHAGLLSMLNVRADVTSQVCVI